MLLKVELEENAIWNCELDVSSSNTILQSMSHALHKYGFIHASEENWSQKKYWSCDGFSNKRLRADQAVEAGHHVEKEDVGEAKVRRISLGPGVHGGSG